MELVKGISNEMLLKLARKGLAQIYDKYMAGLEDAIKATEDEYVIDFFNKKLDRIEADFDKIDNAIEALEKEEVRA